MNNTKGSSYAAKKRKLRGLLKNVLAGSALLITAATANAQVNLQWAKSMGGTSSDLSYATTVDASGNVYITGAFYGTADFDPGAGVANLTAVDLGDIFVAKYDNNGNYVWAKRMGGIGSEMGNSIAVDAAGNVYTTGFFWNTVDFDPGPGVANLTTGGYADIFVSKLDNNGNYVWAKSMIGTDTKNDYGNSITLDAAGNVYITGFFENTVDFDPGAGVANLTSAGGTDIFVSKLDNSGNYVWAKSIGGTNNDQGNSLAIDAAGNVYTTGYFQGTVDFDPGSGIANLTTDFGGSNINVFVSKLDNDGNYVWTKSLGGSKGCSIAIDVTGNVYTTGYFTGTGDFDPGSGAANLTSVGAYDIFVSKLDNNGSYVWAKRMGGASTDFVTSMALDATGNVYTTGYFAGTANFNPAGTANLTSAGNNDIFVSKLDNNGNYVWAKRLGGSNYDYGHSMALDASGNIYLTGEFAGTANFNPNGGTYLSSLSGSDDIFLVKLSETSVTITASENNVCTGTNVTFTATPTGATSPSYQWKVNGTDAGTNSATYTYTPANSDVVTCVMTVSGSPTTSNSITMNVNTSPETPAFTQVAAVCEGTAFTLPTTSDNGISGTWSPAINNTATTTYTFTPTAGQCATTETMTVTVNPQTTPTFTQVAAVCEGTAFTLPTTSDNGISGTWSPAINTTATTTYTFTPTAGQCAATATMTVTVNPQTTPTFTQVAAVCEGIAFTLPTTSDNGISGTWSPAINTTATTTYTFTPTAGQCAATATMTVTVNPQTTPTFTQVAAVCEGTAFTLPTTSGNGISGTWSPAINTTATTTYTFTPTAGQCATTAQMTVTVNPQTTPTFTQVAPVCEGTAFTLPTTSDNGISGNWSPAINNAATTTYTFTPTAGQCAATTQMTVTVNPQTTPTFTQVAAGCEGTAFTLPTTSSDGISGNWSPAINNTATTTYTFTPTAGQCATTETMTVTVNSLPEPVITVSGNVFSTDAGFATYQWMRNGTDLAGATSDTYAATQSGDYSVRVTNTSGCEGISNVISHTDLGVTDITKAKFVVYPNPTMETLNISKVSGKATYAIYDISGKMISKGRITDSKVNVSSLPAAAYFIAVEDKETLEMIRFIKQD